MIGLLYGKSIPSEAYQRYLICKEFGWDYYMYNAQPAWFIDEILLIMYQEAQRKKQNVDSQNRAQRKSITKRH